MSESLGVTRRGALVAAIATAASTSVLQTTPSAATPQVRYRRNIWGMGQRDPVMQSFSFAVAEMKRLDREHPAHPYAWSSIARVHDQYCPHGNWFFLPWHRMYLYAFERICQNITGDNTFRVPFWDWSNNPFVPAAFWSQGGPLFCPRTIAQNQQLPAPATWPQNMAAVLRIRTFDTFASPFAGMLRPSTRDFGALERPHNDVHNCVGGAMLSMMSPLDPLFWIHHANIDRLWWEWIRRGNQNTTNSTWLNFATAGAIMPDRQGRNFPFRVRDALSAEALGYTYETNLTLSFGFDEGRSDAEAEEIQLPEQVPAGVIRRTGAIGLTSAATYAPDQPPQGERADTDAPPAAPPSIREQNEAISRILGGKRGAGSDIRLGASLQLVLEGIEVPRNTASQLRVFLNLPEADATSVTDGANYAGTLSFFGVGMDHGNDAPGTTDHGRRTVSALFDITEQVTALGIASLDDLTISLVAVAPFGARAKDAQTIASGVRFVFYTSK